MKDDTAKIFVCAMLYIIMLGSCSQCSHRNVDEAKLIQGMRDASNASADRIINAIKETK